MIGWEEISHTRLRADSVAQLWANDMVQNAVRQGAKVILSPAKFAYLDMQYDPSTPLGLHWAGYVSVQDSYNWEPAELVKGIGEADILGIEAPLWSETLLQRVDVEFMLFPRLPGLAEIGWSPAGERSWVEYRDRLGAHGPRLKAQRINFFAAPRIPWQ
jgi:hexosaminidase